MFGRNVANFLLALLLFAAAWPSAAQDLPDRSKGTPELMRALAQGGYVIYFRHGHTHWQQKLIEQSMQVEGRLDLGNCATQRNLDPIGRADARRIHAALRAASIPVGKVLSSLYCRPAEYVALITGREPVRTPWLTGLSTPQTLVEIKREVATPPEPGQNTFLGGHGDRPFDLTGLVIQEGDALVFDPRNHRADDPAKFRPVAWIKPAEWLELTGASPTPDEPNKVLGRVTIAAAPHHDNANLRASLPALSQGTALDDAALARTLQLLRENPAKNAEPLFKATSQAGALDVDVAVASAKPWAFSAGLVHASAHASSQSGGEDRLWFGAEHHNLWNRDHQLAMQVSQARHDASDGGDLSAAYRVPIYGLGAMLGVIATRVRDGNGLNADLEPLRGTGRSVGVYFRQHLTPRADYHHHATLAIDDAEWTSTSAPRLRSRPLTLSYAAHWEQEWIGWKFDARALTNLPGGAGNDAASYAAAAGPTATRKWQAVRLRAEWLRILTYDIRLRLAGRAQWSNDTLIDGERFTLGATLKPWGSAFGVAARAPWFDRGGVRGLPERAVGGDSGAQASVELWSRRLFGLDLRGGGFVDIGTVRRKQPQPGAAAGASASSLGLGLHYQWRGNVAVSANVAHLLRGGALVDAPSQRIDLAVTGRY